MAVINIDKKSDDDTGLTIIFATIGKTPNYGNTSQTKDVISLKETNGNMDTDSAIIVSAPSQIYESSTS